MKFAKLSQTLLGAKWGKPVSDAQTSNQLSAHHHKKPGSLDENGKAEIKRHKEKKKQHTNCFSTN